MGVLEAEYIKNPVKAEAQKITANQSQRFRDPKDKSRTEKVVQIPGGFFPHATFKEALWITMTAKQLKGQNTAGRGGTLRIGKTGTIFKFLAPETIIEAHNHDWQEYETIQSKLLQKIVSYSVGYQQGKDIVGGVAREVGKLFKAKNYPAGRTLLNSTINASNVGIPKFKVDTPLVYKNSQRRNWQLTFILADDVGGHTVMDAVKQIQRYAAPSSKQDILSIEFPWVFELATIPEGLIQANFAALTSIQPSWMAPYIKGRPTRCELTLSFIDMSPLFEQTIETGGLINIVNSEGTDPAEPSLAEQMQQSQKEMKATKLTQKPISPPAIAAKKETFHWSSKYSNQSYDEYVKGYNQRNP